MLSILLKANVKAISSVMVHKEYGIHQSETVCRLCVT